DDPGSGRGHPARDRRLALDQRRGHLRHAAVAGPLGKPPRGGGRGRLGDPKGTPYAPGQTPSPPKGNAPHPPASRGRGARGRGVGGDGGVAGVGVRGRDEPVSWEQTGDGLVVTLPTAAPASAPVSLRIAFAGRSGSRRRVSSPPAPRARVPSLRGG